MERSTEDHRIMGSFQAVAPAPLILESRFVETFVSWTLGLNLPRHRAKSTEMQYGLNLFIVC